MDAAIANVRAMAEAAAINAAAQETPLELPMKRARKDAACAPCKKARTSLLKDTTLTDEESLLGSYWTTLPDRRGDMILVRRSHRLSRSWAAHVVLVQTLKWPIRCAVKHLTNNKNSPLGLFIVLSFLIVVACSYFVCIITVSFCLRLVYRMVLAQTLKRPATLVLVKTL